MAFLWTLDGYGWGARIKTTPPRPAYFWKYPSWSYESWHRHTPNYAVSKDKKITDNTLFKNADANTFFDVVSKVYGKMGLFLFLLQIRFERLLEHNRNLIWNILEHGCRHGFIITFAEVSKNVLLIFHLRFCWCFSIGLCIFSYIFISF